MTESDRNEVAPLWTAEEVADYLKVEASTVKQWAKLDRIPHVRAGSLYRFRKVEIDAWTEERANREAASPKANGTDAGPADAAA